METYPIEIEPVQLVDWIIAESRVSPSEFKIRASRSVETPELPARKELRLGGEEREDLSEIATVGTLEIASAQAAEGWTLIVVVEDEFGPRIFDDPESVAGEREIELAAFYDLFIRPRRGNASAMVTVDSPADRARVTRLTQDIEADRHGSSRRG